MTGLDTNLIIRLLVQDDLEQLRRTREVIANECTAENPGLINSIVLVEVVWVLSSAYGYHRPHIAHAIETLFQIKEIQIQYADEAWEALTYFRNGKADFSDGYLAAINRRLGCRDTLTLDKKAARIDLFRAI